MNTRQHLKRIFIDILLFVSVFIAPWWFTVILGFILVFLFENFYEVLIIGLIIDSLYGAHSLTWTIAFSLLFLFSLFVKKHLKFKN
ncbi:MAG TPA: hypothetical protein VJC12_02275 [Candidatus Paceibacterota bacterium]